MESSAGSPSEAIVDSRLHVKHDLSPADVRNQTFALSVKNKAHFLSQLLVYERIVIPTTDFAILPALVRWLTVDGVQEILDQGTLLFIHRPSLLGYCGNGVGISPLTITAGESAPFRHWWQQALFSEASIAIDLQLAHGGVDIDSKQRAAIASKALELTKLADFDTEFFKKNIAHETYQNAVDTPEICAMLRQLAARSGWRADFDLRLLPDVAPNQIRLANEGEVTSTADLLVRIAEANMEIAMAYLAEGADIHISSGAEAILKRRILTRQNVALADQFARLLELESVPDVGTAVEAGIISSADVLALRRRSVARQFREWLRRAEPSDADDLCRMYVASLGEESWVKSAPVRLIRFAITASTGLVASLATELGVSVADDFFVDKYLSGFRPKLMLDELRRLSLY
jgi:hypothetical protein